MRCTRCGRDNPLSARFCAGCGAPFSEEERKAAYDRTIYGKLDRLKEAKSWITLEKITSNPLFRIRLLAVIILLGVMNGRNKGNVMRPLESEDYKVYYNRTSDDWFLSTEMDRVNVGIYLPGKPEGVTVKTIDRDSALLDEKEYSLSDDILLEKDEDNIYILEGRYDGSSKQIRLMVVPPEMLE